jgi:hypothetical protein
MAKGEWRREVKTSSENGSRFFDLELRTEETGF